MRIRRAVTVGTVALLVATVALHPAQALAQPSAPAAPYTALTINGAAGNYPASTGTRVYDRGNATLSLSQYGTGFILNASSPDGARWSTRIQPPTGGELIAGTRYSARRLSDATHAALDVYGEGRGCNMVSGWFDVKEFARDAETGVPTVAAVTYWAGCENNPVPMQGEVRFNSTVGYGATALDARSLDFGQRYVGRDRQIRTLTVTSAGSLPVTLADLTIEGPQPPHFEIAATTCDGVSLAYGDSCEIDVEMSPRARGQLSGRLTFAEADAPDARREIVLFGTAVISADGTYNPVGPQRLLDTRSGLGAPRAAAVVDEQVLGLTVGGRAGVPASGVSAVVLNVTVTGPTAPGHLTLYPSGSAAPTSSNLNFVAGRTIANSVTVPVGPDGTVSILHRGGSTHIIADITGYYIGTDAVPSGGTLGDEFYMTHNERILDTRDAYFGGPLRGGWYAYIPVDYGDDTNDRISALAVNVTAVKPVGSGHLTSWDGVQDPPTASTLNFTPGRTVPNMAIVPVAPCPDDLGCAGLPTIWIHNGSADPTHILVDIFGLYMDTDLADGTRFRPVDPTRIVDTRTGLGAPTALGPTSTATIATPTSVITDDTEAVSMNITAVRPTANTHVSVWPAYFGTEPPSVSTLNPYQGETVPNAAITGIFNDGDFNIYNHAGTTHVVVDIAGTFEYVYDDTEFSDASARGAGARSRVGTGGDTGIPTPPLRSTSSRAYPTPPR
ncbi:choice-of-anchor D domain-containing protein [Solwaraspora sp. WMMD406]|uniref:choice-of-anchor D domain-containing protein n=1 Tax=Solwaraspora sp. WMMD406 TaxID=3016095 RepID=UPI00241615C7|nr:choice-of-anchor D domain-containing protein [Solwaraspora sp. WMMD406]MDG4763267.1 choice-of-anchor D domain-containing protein [Solwaraspora sp. WMMD406]